MTKKAEVMTGFLNDCNAALRNAHRYTGMFLLEQTLKSTRKLQVLIALTYLGKKAQSFRLDGDDYRQIHTHLCRCNERLV